MKKIFKAILIFFIIIIGAILFALSNQVGGWRAFIVSSASMEPTIQTGSLIITRYTHPTILQKNDIITFIPPDKKRSFITHRIQSISKNGNYATLKTKGDNNDNIDNWNIAGGSVVGKAYYWVPRLGYIFSFTQTKLGIALFILIPSIFIILDEILQIISLFKKHTKEKLPQSFACILVVATIAITACSITIQQTHATLSGTVKLTNNHFTTAAKNTQNQPQIHLLKTDVFAMFILNNIQKYNKLSYKLTYDTNTVPQGIQGEDKLNGLPVYASKLIRLGTCSKKDCIFHQQIRHLVLTITLYSNTNSITLSKKL